VGRRTVRLAAGPAIRPACLASGPRSSGTAGGCDPDTPHQRMGSSSSGRPSRSRRTLWAPSAAAVAAAVAAAGAATAAVAAAAGAANTGDSSGFRISRPNLWRALLRACPADPQAADAISRLAVGEAIPPRGGRHRELNNRHARWVVPVGGYACLRTVRYNSKCCAGSIGSLQ
jgi:hypothetical protein